MEAIAPMLTYSSNFDPDLVNLATVLPVISLVI